MPSTKSHWVGRRWYVPGSDVTVAATGWMVHKALAVAGRVADRASIEVVDLRSLAPLDIETVVASVRKTSRLVVAHEAWKVGGIGAEVAAAISEEALDALDAPIVRIGAPHIPVPSTKPLRDLFLPGRGGCREGHRQGHQLLRRLFLGRCSRRGIGWRLFSQIGTDNTAFESTISRLSASRGAREAPTKLK